MIRVNGSPAPTMNPCEAKKKMEKKKKMHYPKLPADFS